MMVADRVCYDNHTLAQPWLFAVSTTVLVLETLVRGEGKLC